MTEQIVRRGAASLVELVLEIVLGAWLLLLLALAVAWDPLDRRIGLHARRRAKRFDARPGQVIDFASESGRFEAYGVAASPAA